MPRPVIRSVAAAWVRMLVLVMCGVPTWSCYEYRAAEIEAIRPSETVHVVLSPKAAVELKPSIGPNAATVDGTVIGVERDRLRLAVTQIERSIGPEEFLTGEPLELPWSGAAAITVRRFDRTRTVLAIGGILASAFAAASVANQPAIAPTHGGTGVATR